MERLNKFSTYFLLILFLLVTSVSAVTVSFVDSSYMGENDYTITDNSGSYISNFTGDSTVNLPQGKSYFINFQPRGLFDFSEQQPGNLTYPNSILDFFSKNLAGLIVLLAIMFIAVKWRGHS